MFVTSKIVILNWLVHGGQLYSAFPFSKDSLVLMANSDTHSSLVFYGSIDICVKS
jgi:hypothetical protein